MEEMLTKDDFKSALIRLGVKKGMLLYVSASMDQFRYVVGGVQSMIEALMELVGYDGTIVMAAPTRHLCDPVELGVIPRDRADEARSHALPFNKKLSVSCRRNTCTPVNIQICRIFILFEVFSI